MPEEHGVSVLDYQASLCRFVLPRASSGRVLTIAPSFDILTIVFRGAYNAEPQ
jgi:hypothetical protein